MRRTLRTTLLIAAPLLLAALPAVAEEVVSIVTGLAPGDLLNVRAAPSAIGKTEARLAGGARLKNFGCNDVNGNPWCKVEDLDHPEVSGWVPARYLIPTNPAAVPDKELPAEANAAAAPAAGTTQAGPESAAAAAPAEAAGSPAVAPQQPPAAPLPDLTARLGGPETAPKSAASIGKTAMQDAYGLAFAANENPSAGVMPAPVAEEQPLQDSGAVPAADTGAAPAGVPVPTPRPGAATAAPAAEPQIVARAEPAGPSAADATSEIPCARYVGQPMVPCRASVVRTGGDKADITVIWPDGGSRVISFYAGLPAGSNARSDFRFTREGSLSMIRIGVSERFEITDALALGD